LKKSYPASTNFLVRLARQRDGGLGRSRHIIPRFRSALLLPDKTNKDIAHEVHYGNA
jgi:hypothetical protein